MLRKGWRREGVPITYPGVREDYYHIESDLNVCVWDDCDISVYWHGIPPEWARGCYESIEAAMLACEQHLGVTEETDRITLVRRYCLRVLGCADEPDMPETATQMAKRILDLIEGTTTQETPMPEPKPLTPPDRERCQAEVPNGHSFMTLGGRPGHVRCASKPDVIVTELKPGTDGQTGSMSLCHACHAVLQKQVPGYAAVSEIL